MKTKEAVIFRTIGRIQKESTKQPKTTDILMQLLSYSLVAEDVPTEVRFMKALCKDYHEAALQAYMSSHSLSQIREACEFVRTMEYGLDD